MNFQLENNKLYCWQWDIKQKLIIKDFEDWDDSFFILIGNSKVQKELFKIKPDKEIDDFFVKIPDEILQKEGTAEVYIYNESTGTTISAWRFTIKKKDKPQDYIYEKTEVLTLVQLQNEIEKISEQTIPELAKELKNFVAEEISKAESDNIKIDSSLSKKGFAADAKAVGDKLKQKVEKIEGKSLSSNDFTNTYKRKLDEALTFETDPTVPEWAKQPLKPTYNAAEVGALPDTTELLELDNTLKEAGKAADAKIVGDAFIAEREYINSQRLGWIEGGDIHTIDPKFIITNGKRNNVLAIGDIDENNFPNKLISLSGIGGIINENEFLEILPRTPVRYQGGYKEIKGEFSEVKVDDELKIIFNDEEFNNIVINSNTIQPDNEGWFVGNLGLHPLSDFMGATDDGGPFLVMFSPDGVTGDSEPGMGIITRDGSILSYINIYKNIQEIIKINHKIIPLSENELVGGVKTKTATVNMTEPIGIDKNGYLFTDTTTKANKYTDSQRLGYVEFAMDEIFPEQEVTFNRYSGLDMVNLEITGADLLNKISIKINGELYKYLEKTKIPEDLISGTNEEFYYYGNPYILNTLPGAGLSDQFNTGQPFLFISDASGLHGYIQPNESQEIETYTVGVWSNDNEIIHKIDEKFIPDSIAKVAAIEDINEDMNNLSKEIQEHNKLINYTAEYGVTDFETLKQAQEKGQKIWISWPEKDMIIPMNYYKNDRFDVYFMEDFDTVHRINCDSTNGWTNGIIPLQTKNMTQVISTSPSTTQYPSEKAVADALSNILPKVTSADTGSFLRVSSEGKWIAEILTNVAEVGA